MGRLPHWAEGRMRNCVVCDYWYPERSGKIVKDRDGKWKCVKTCIDTLTQAERQEQIIKR